MKVRMAQLVGKSHGEGTEVIMIFRVDDKYYPATESNCRVFETYMQTGDKKYLESLEMEMEV